MASLWLAVGALEPTQAGAIPRLATSPTPGAHYQDGPDGRYLLDGTWLLRADPANRGVSQGLWRDGGSTRGWRAVAVPSAFNVADFSNASWRGTVNWYRRDFTLPRGAFSAHVPHSARHWVLRFESVNYRATVWLNGHFLGGHVGEGLPFEFALAGARPGLNHVIVRVDNRRLPGDLHPGAGGGWWNYGGILRDVYLRAVARADIPRVRVRTFMRCATCRARILEQVLVRNPTNTTQRVRLGGRFGNAALRFGTHRIAPHGSWSATASVFVPHPRLWSPSRPFLYRSALTLTDTKARTLRHYLVHTGIRTIKVTRTGLLTLNGRRVHLRGVELREQDMGRGAAMTVAALRREFAWARQLGATLIRVDSPNPVIEELADRAGMLVWSDVPVDGPVNNVSAAHRLLKENILANENHASVMLWSIGNELPAPLDSTSASYVGSAARLSHRLDPTRPVAVAISDWPGLGCEATYRRVDVIGLNEYFGWYDAGGGSTDDREALSPFLDSVRACYRHRALLVSVLVL